MDEKTENYWNTYKEINEWIRYSDTKAGVLVAVYGVFLTIIYANAEAVYLIISSGYILVFLTILCAIFSCMSIYFSFKCLNPRLKNLNPKSVFYFGHIKQNKTYRAYLKYSEKIFAKKENTIEQLAEQVFVNSTIAWKKFYNISIAIRFLFSSLATLILILIIYYFKK